MSNKAFKVKHGLELPNGTPVDEFSIDGTMVGNSDDAVPTEKAVKTYVDNNSTVSYVDGGASASVYAALDTSYDGGGA